MGLRDLNDGHARLDTMHHAQLPSLRRYGTLGLCHSALQGLLKKLGAGFEDMLPGVLGMGNGKVKVCYVNLCAPLLLQSDA